MRTGRILTAVNWRYAIGELLLIVVGILVALAISDWYDQRIQRQQELALLGELQTALEADVLALESKLEEIEGAVAQIEHLVSLFSEPPPYEPALDRLFGSVYGFRNTNLSSAAYQSLKSEGLQKVTNLDLRARIARVFDFHYQRLEGAHAIEQEITLNVLRPYYLQHFVDLKFHENATPIDYQMVMSDTRYRNLINYRIANLRFNHMSYYPEAISEMKAAIRQIEEEFDR